MSTTYSISDLARELDITTRAIRFYEEQGLLRPERRGQERIYSPRDKVSLKLILRGKRIGFFPGRMPRTDRTLRPQQRQSKAIAQHAGKNQRTP